jgi:hypothetical protein
MIFLYNYTFKQYNYTLKQYNYTLKQYNYTLKQYITLSLNIFIYHIN